jgi:hypothetical protein
MDVVYLVRPGEENEELRYSLRSLKNMPHDKVFISGYKPSWAATRHIRSNSTYSPFRTTTNNLIAACESRAGSDDFILMNDDFFIMNEVDSIKPYNRGPYKNIIEKYQNKGTRNRYVVTMKRTERYLETLGLPTICYELHMPMIINKRKMLELIREIGRNQLYILNKRSMYGNYVSIGGRKVDDVKVITTDKISNKTFVSTTDHTFRVGKIGAKIRRKFKEPMYEK